MLIDKQSRGVHKYSVKEFALLAKLALWPANGYSLNDVIPAFTALGEKVSIPSNASWSDVVSWGRSGRGMVVQGNYWKLSRPVRLQQPGNTNWDGGHAIYVDRIEGSTVYFMDPLQKSGGIRTMPLSDLEAYAKGLTRREKMYVAVEKASAAGSGATSIQQQLLVWVKEVGLDPSSPLTSEQLREFLAWYARKQSPSASAKEIAAFVAEGWGLVSGWVGKTPAFLSSSANDPEWKSADPLTAIGSAAGSLTDALAFVMDPQNWVRVFAFLIGLFLLWTGGKMVFDASG
jgi:hypothetical protein